MSRDSPHDMWAYFGLNDAQSPRPVLSPNPWPVAFAYDPYSPRQPEKWHKITNDELEMLENEAL